MRIESENDVGERERRVDKSKIIKAKQKVVVQQTSTTTNLKS